MPYISSASHWSASGGGPTTPPPLPTTRFAVLIAARNEAAVIGNLVDSLFAQNYPRDLYEVIVAPNNCTDDTEAVARAHGARIFRPQGRITGKGEVLRQAVDAIALRERFDAICVFDADNLVDPDFLARMNDAFCSGAAVAQGFRDSKNPRQSAISGCYSICYWMLSRFYNNAREVLGLSALVNGSGFMVSCALLRRLGAGIPTPSPRTMSSAPSACWQASGCGLCPARSSTTSSR